MPDDTALLLKRHFDTVFAHEYAWKVSAEEIVARNYNLDCKNPHEVAVNHRDPQELMAEYLEIAHQMKAAQDALKQELMGALGGK